MVPLVFPWAWTAAAALSIDDLTDDEAELMDSRLLTLATQVESNREVEGLQTRPGEEQSVGTRQHVRAPRNGGCFSVNS